MDPPVFVLSEIRCLCDCVTLPSEHETTKTYLLDWLVGWWSVFFFVGFHKEGFFLPNLAKYKIWRIRYVCDTRSSPYRDTRPSPYVGI